MFVNVIGWSKTSGYLSVQLFSTGIAGVLEPGEQGGNCPPLLLKINQNCLKIWIIP